MRILIIEDNQDLASNMLDFLEAKEHVVDVAGDGITGMHLALVNRYDAIVLDLMLPRIDGITLCRKIREEGRMATPILIITARDSLDDKIAGLEAGADDYLVKPVEMREVELRLRVLQRRGREQIQNQKLEIGELSIDLSTRTVRRGTEVILLPPIPYRILEVLMERSPQVVSRDDIEHEVWGDSRPDSDALRAHMHLLRALIDKPFGQKYLRTLRGFGYQLKDGDEPDQ